MDGVHVHGRACEALHTGLGCAYMLALVREEPALYLICHVNQRQAILPQHFAVYVVFPQSSVVEVDGGQVLRGWVRVEPTNISIRLF